MKRFVVCWVLSILLLPLFGCAPEEKQAAVSATVLEAFAAQAKEAVAQDLTLPAKLYGEILPYMVTDISVSEAVYLATQAVSYTFARENLYSLRGEIRMGEQFEEFYPDETALYELILQVFYEEE